MQQYFIPESQLHEHHVVIQDEDARHIIRVMRMKPGDRIICVVGGTAFLCRIDELSGNEATAEIESAVAAAPELPVSVTIAQGIPKGEKFDTIVQKGTECGASAFIPFNAARSVAVWRENRTAKKRLRLQKIAKGAAEQSHRLVIPRIAEPLGIDRLIQAGLSFTYKLVAYEETAKSGELTALPALLHQMSQGDSLLAVIGPEGGLTAEEAEKLQRSGFVLCGFGPRILRTETAPIYLLSAVSYQLELLNNEVDN
ncbi:16S rRNA (uracil(1498)-N(3))-methyltransferase [Sporolactobacillus vineae]|uniref:16S rRNA (uracil(1498)-N(3))-methyltransferase n=1 Tax=Sporolactobacillus vineae TaxID=444463 RepID=UPI000289F254|nr:16S rRNA (uracil(1498)-N(3))-methyltransferase [Sporolactobacillus vineae]